MTPIGALSRLGLIALLACVSLASGCQSGAGRGAHGVTASQFQDMVVPAGLRLRDGANESYSRQEASWRQGRFEYIGSTAVDEAMNYVRQRMPQHSWSVVRDEMGADDVATLRFERGIYAAEYTFQRRDGATHMTVLYSTDYSRR